MLLDRPREVEQRVADEISEGNTELRRRFAVDRHLSALAELGQIAIRVRSLDALVDEAAAVVADTLDTEYSAVLKVLPGKEECILCAGVGWKAGLVGHQTVSAVVGTAAGFLLRSGAPIVVADLRRETRFERPAAWLEHGAMSAVNVIVRGPGRPWGILGAHTARPRSFDSDDVGFLVSVANVLSLAIERHEHEAAQSREKEILEAVFDNIPVMISFYDASGRLLRVNQEWERVLGWTLEEAQQTDILAEVYPDPERRRQALEFIVSAERRWADFRIRARDGTTIDASWARFALSDGSRIGFGLDITERRRADEALRESEVRFRQLAESINEVFWLANCDATELLYVSPAYERIFGRSRESAYREPRSWLQAVHPEDRDRVERAANEKSSSGEVDETYRVLRPDGSVRWIRDRGFPIRDASGKVYRFAGIAEDVTDRRGAEEDRARLLASETSARAAAEATLERLRSIQSITDTALAHLVLDELLRELLARLRKVLRTEYATVLLIDEQRQVLTVRAHDNGRSEGTEGSSAPFVALEGTISGRVASDGQALIFDHVLLRETTAWNSVYRALGLRSAMGAPLFVEGKVIGVVSVASTNDRAFTGEDLTLLQVVADRVAPAIERGRLAETVDKGRERLKELSRRLLVAHEDERRRVAVELHDELGQVLTAAKISLESVASLSGVAVTPDRLGDAIGCVDRAMQKVRDLALDLRPSVLDDLGLAAALRWYVDRFARTTGLETYPSIDTVAKLEPELETTCFRLAQEALTNVARHARATRVWFDLHLLDDGLKLTVRDDGIGFDVPVARARAISGASLGLLGMEERVSLVGGEFEILSTPGDGTEVRVHFPVGGKSRHAR